MNQAKALNADIIVKRQMSDVKRPPNTPNLCFRFTSHACPVWFLLRGLAFAVHVAASLR